MCDCPERPKCGLDWCEEPAAWSVFEPPWPPRSERFTFMCRTHHDMYREPIPGIDRPKHADEDWRPSLTDAMKLASINAAVASPKGSSPHVPKWSRDARYTPGQMEQVRVFRRAMREMAADKR